MVHHCHCGFREHFQAKGIRKLGVAGAIFMLLHLLFHVVECLLLPSLLVAFGGHVHGESAHEHVSTDTVAAEQLTTAEGSGILQTAAFQFLPRATSVNLCTDSILCSLEINPAHRP